MDMDLFAARHIVRHYTRYAATDVVRAVYAINDSLDATVDDITLATSAIVLRGLDRIADLDMPA